MNFNQHANSSVDPTMPQLEVFANDDPLAHTCSHDALVQAAAAHLASIQGMVGGAPGQGACGALPLLPGWGAQGGAGMPPLPLPPGSGAMRSSWPSIMPLGGSAAAMLGGLPPHLAASMLAMPGVAPTSATRFCHLFFLEEVGDGVS